MNPIVNHLIQLQELTQIRAEQKIAGGHLQQLDDSIADMARRLAPDVRDRFEKLQRKDPLVITPISEGGCAVCGMHLPISLVQLVRKEGEIHACPNCTRMLYYPEAGFRRLGIAARRTGPRKVGISRFSSHSLMVPRLATEDAEGVVMELTRKMEGEGFIEGAENLAEAAIRREAIISTASEHGLAFPHVRGVEGGGLALALGLSAKGVRFGAPGGKLTRIVFLIVIPTAASAFYLRLLAGLTETFLDAEARKALLAEQDAETLWKTLCKLTRATIK
jgi:mannitol/fructose-specific phosphotransferase system IIA component (Ntr-type)